MKTKYFFLSIALSFLFSAVSFDLFKINVTKVILTNDYFKVLSRFCDFILKIKIFCFASVFTMKTETFYVKTTEAERQFEFIFNDC